MIVTYEPDQPWDVGQEVVLHHDNGHTEHKVVERIDGYGYVLIDKRVWELRQQGVRPYGELT